VIRPTPETHHTFADGYFLVSVKDGEAFPIPADPEAHRTGWPRLVISFPPGVLDRESYDRFRASLPEELRSHCGGLRRGIVSRHGRGGKWVRQL